ncbi:filamin A protein cher isoform X2 [Dermatophagoides farinae]
MADIAKPTIVDNHDGTICVKYDPKQQGNYEMQIKYNNLPIKGSPYKFIVDNTPKGLVTAFGAGLSTGVAGDACSFNVYTKGAGAGNLQVAVEGPSKAEINCKDNKDGSINVTFTPPAPGEYKINVNFAGKPIEGSPFSAKIVGEGRKRNQISIGMSSEVPLKVTEKDVKSLNASIVAPSGLEEPCFVKKLSSNQVGISFTPREHGEHAVNVKKMGNHVAGSPFKINVLERDIGDSKNVKITGAGLKEGKTNTANEINIDTSDAGYGGLSVSIEGPSKADIQYKDKGNGKLATTYKPTEPGFYILNVKFADHHVPGSPYTIKVTGPGSNIQRNNIKLGREAASIADVGSKCKLTFKFSQTSAFDLAAKIMAPSGETEDAEILDLQDFLYAVQFVPKEVGIHTVSVRHKDIHIPGSPFQFTVGPFTDFGSHRVHAGGPGLERGTVNEKCEFNIWTREAGAGTLAVSVEGPSKAEIDFHDRKDGSGFVTYKVTEPGDYRIGIKFNDQPIPDSPYNVYVMAQVGDARKIEIGAIPPEHMLKVNSPVTFTINMNGAKGSLDGKVIAPSGAEDDCFLSKIDDDQWALRFIPRENGVHRIHVRFNGVHIPESPFSMRIGKDDADPASVSVTGSGIKEARTGVKTDFIIDTCNAGAGTLAVTIDGPTKVSMDCTEVEEGYKVRYTPLAPGEYLITIKYNGYHIVGSPFKIRCMGTRSIADISDFESSQVVVETVTKHSKNQGNLMPKFKSEANRVESKGVGLKRAILNRQNTFNVNASNAGNNFLFVAVFGPRGPCEAIDIRHQGRNNYNITYTTRERGDHIIVVRYGDDHIPGSPFKIDCNP